jgi:large subunit ribosomal protein L6
MLSNYTLRQTKNLDIQILCLEKRILLNGLYGSFIIPIKSPFLYLKKERKIHIQVSSLFGRSLSKLFFLLLLQLSLGVLLGYRKQLNLVGIGYQVEIDNFNVLILKLGYSHLVRIKIPGFLEVLRPKPRIILLKSINLYKLNNFALLLRRLKLPSSYKEKGLYLLGEKVLLKQGKKT